MIMKQGFCGFVVITNMQKPLPLYRCIPDVKHFWCIPEWNLMTESGGGWPENTLFQNHR